MENETKFEGEFGEDGSLESIKEVSQDKPEKWETISPRRFGKNTEALLDFFFEGKRGKAVVFATPEGNFLSPKAVENLLTQTKNELCEKVEGLKKEIEVENPMTTLEFTHEGMINGYNSALSDILEILKTPLEE